MGETERVRKENGKKWRQRSETVKVEGRGVGQWEKRWREQNEKRGRDRGRVKGERRVRKETRERRERQTEGRYGG